MPEETAKPLDVILDTDIGSDVDDAYAVLFALESPELDVKGIVPVHADVDFRAVMTFKLLKMLGRTDVPVALGEKSPMNPERQTYWGGHEGRGVDFSDVADMKPVKENGIEFIARTASENPGEVVLVTIGPLTDAGVLIRDYPEEARKLKGIVSMASTFNGYGPENAGREHNIALDPESVDLVVKSGIPTLFVGLNVTLKTALTADHMEQIRAFCTPLGDVITVMTEDWFRIRKSHTTAMHDPLAVAAAFDPDVVTTIPVRAEVSIDNPGYVTYYEAGEESPLRICTSIDADRFHGVFLERVMRACGKS